MYIQDGVYILYINGMERIKVAKCVIEPHQNIQHIQSQPCTALKNGYITRVYMYSILVSFFLSK